MTANTGQGRKQPAEDPARCRSAFCQETARTSARWKAPRFLPGSRPDSTDRQDRWSAAEQEAEAGRAEYKSTESETVCDKAEASPIRRMRKQEQSDQNRMNA